MSILIFETNLSILNNDLSKIVHSTYIGGKGSAGGVVKLNDGRYFISGYAFGDIKLVNGNNNYKYHGGESDGFFTVFDSDLSNCQFFGYIDGAARDAADGHILLNNGNVLMFGTTESEIFYGGSSSSSWGKCKNNDVFIKIINPKSFMK